MNDNIISKKRLVEKYLNDGLSQGEESDLLQWLRDDEGVALWLQREIKAESGEIGRETSERMFGDISHSRETDSGLLRRIKTKWRQRRMVFMAVVATAMLMFLSVYGIVKWLNTEKEESAIKVYTSHGDCSKVTLPDGTNVSLNSMSEVCYHYDRKGKRRVVELRGEAYFDVKKDKQHPFHVYADGMDVECRGTQFNVKAYKDDDCTMVSLNEGKVRVSIEDQSIDLSPNTVVMRDKRSGALMKFSADASGYSDWQKGYMRFSNASLQEIINVLFRTYNVNINVLSHELQEERFTGSLYKADVKKVMNMITLASGAKYSVVNDSTINLSY